jgi:hypothetical protein
MLRELTTTTDFLLPLTADKAEASRSVCLIHDALAVSTAPSSTS